MLRGTACRRVGGRRDCSSVGEWGSVASAAAAASEVGRGSGRGAGSAAVDSRRSQIRSGAGDAVDGHEKVFRHLRQRRGLRLRRRSELWRRRILREKKKAG